jgi:carbonyl reductase 1
MKTALVTGANKGIGFEIARGLLKSGEFRVILGCRDPERANQAASKLKDLTGVSADKIAVLAGLDLASTDSIRAAAQTLLKMCEPERKPLSVLVNNAGFAFKYAAKEPTGEQARVTCGINYFGTLSVCDNFFPLLRDGGRVVNVGSRSGVLASFSNDKLREQFDKVVTNKTTVAELSDLVNTYVRLAQSGKHIEEGFPRTTYSTSKAVLHALTRIHANEPELRARRIVVNTLTPGYCISDMTKGVDGTWDEGCTRTAAQGAETPIWLALSEEGGTLNGAFVDEEQKPISYLDGRRI